MKRSLLISLLFALRVTFAAAADQAPPPAVGNHAPEFSLPSQEGVQVSLDQFK